MVNLEIKEVTTGKNNENKGNVSAYVKETGFTISIDQTMQLVSFANQIKGSSRTLVNCCEDVAKNDGVAVTATDITILADNICEIMDCIMKK